MTTNHIDKLDSALIRDGRIDIKLHFDKCSNEITREIVSYYFKVDINLLDKYTFIENNHTLAEVINICMKYDNLDDVCKCLGQTSL